MRKYRSIAYALIGVISILLIVVLPLVSGGYLNFPFNVIVSFLIFLVANIAVSFLMNRYANKKGDDLVRMFNVDCDPARFINEGRQVANQIKSQAPVEQWGAWYLAAYAMALIDQDEAKEATTYIQAISRSAAEQTSPEERLAILINLLEPLKELLGNESAEECIAEINALVEANPQLSKQKGLHYVAWLQTLLAAETSTDKDALIHAYSQIVYTESAEMRKRVWAADKLGDLYQQRGDVEGETSCREFVIQSGNTMTAHKKAEMRLNQLP